MSEEPWHVHMEVAQRERDDDEDEHRLLPRLDVVCQRAQECQARVLLRHKRMPTEEPSAQCARLCDKEGRHWQFSEGGVRWNGRAF